MTEVECYSASGLGGHPRQASGQLEKAAALHEPLEGGGKTREKARGPKEMILNPVKHLKRLFGPKEPSRDYSKDLAEAARKLESPQEEMGSARDSGSGARSPPAVSQLTSGKLYHVAHKASGGDSGKVQQATAGLGGGVVRPATEAEPKEGLVACEQEAGRLKEAFDRGQDVTTAAGSKASSIAVATSNTDPARPANTAGAKDHMKEALAFYEREADMLKQRVLASRQVLPKQF